MSSRKITESSIKTPQSCRDLWFIKKRKTLITSLLEFVWIIISFFFFYQSQENISMINIHSHAHIQIEFQSDSNLKISLCCASLHNISSVFFMLYVFTNSASIIVSFFLYVLCSLQTSKSCHHPVTELVLVLQNTKQSPSEINYRYIMPDGIPRSFRSDRRLR